MSDQPPSQAAVYQGLRAWYLARLRETAISHILQRKPEMMTPAMLMKLDTALKEAFSQQLPGDPAKEFMLVMQLSSSWLIFLAAMSALCLGGLAALYLFR